MQTCKNCQSTIPDNARICVYCRKPISRDDNARKHLFMTLRQAILPASLVASVSLGSYVILFTLVLMYVVLGLFLRPSGAAHASPPALIVTPLTVDFGTVVMGNKPPQPRILTVENRSSSSLHWTADTSKASWLQLDTNSRDIGPHMQEPVKASIDARRLSLRPIAYLATIFFRTNGISTPVQVRVTIIAPGKLCVRPDHLNFGNLDQGATGKLFVIVGDCGAQPLRWSISAGKENWVSTSLDHGRLDPGKQQNIQVAVDTSQLPPSSTAYPASLTFSSDKGSQTVPITVTVTSSAPPPKQVPGWSVHPTSLNPSLCTLNKDSTWKCTVTLTEDASAQENINWSSASNLGATFNPPLGGLRPNESQLITISAITCQNDTFTFYGEEGETPNTISWSCTPPCITANPTSLSFAVMQGQPGEAQNVTFTNCGSDAGNVSILPTTTDHVSWLNINSVNTQSLRGSLASNMGQTISVSISSTNLQPGMYQGTITASIATGTGTGMAATNVTLTVSPCFTVDQTSLSYTSPVQEGLQKVTFTNCGTSAGNVSISSSTSDSANWLSIDSYYSQILSGSLGAGETDTIYFNVSDSGLTPYTYQGMISATLTTNGMTTSAPVSVTLTVLSQPHMTVNPSPLDFGTLSQGQQSSLPLTIGNTGEQTLDWSAIAGDKNLVTLDTSTGTVQAKGQQTINVTVHTSYGIDITYLKPGTYSSTLTFKSDADNSPVQVTIKWAVTSPPSMSVYPTSLQFTVDVCGECCSGPGTPTPTPTPIRTYVTIKNSGGGMLTWTVGTPSEAWLTVIPNNNSDGAGQSTQLELDITWSQGESTSATVDITPSYGQTVPITVKITPNSCVG